MKTRTSFIIKTLIASFLAIYQMSHFLFYKYGDMVLAGKHYNSGVEAGMSDAFLYFVLALVLGAVIWFAAMLIMSFAERLLNKRASEKRRAKKEEEKEGDVFHD
jgi:hypothetical protein